MRKPDPENQDYPAIEDVDLDLSGVVTALIGLAGLVVTVLIVLILERHGIRVQPG